MKDVQCYELFGGIALKNHAFSFFSSRASFYAVFLANCGSGESLETTTCLETVV